MKLKEARIIVDNELKEATPELVAELFAGMYSDEQAAFFNHVAEIASKWTFPEMQLQHITDEPSLTLGGRRVMQGIGDYSHWGLVPRAKAV